MTPDPHRDTVDAPDPQPGTLASGTQANRLSVLSSLQEFDTHHAQVDHRVEHLPERLALTETHAELATVASQARELDSQVRALERRQRAHEDEVAKIEAKRSHNSERLYDSHMTSPKEAEALTAEAASLQRRQLEIEDLILELMEELEPLTAAQSVLTDRQSQATVRVAELEVAIAQAESAANTERDELARDRAALVESSDTELVAMYEQRRAAARGAPAVGRLIGATCDACHLELPAVDRDHIARLDPDEIVDCPQCGVLLVR